MAKEQPPAEVMRLTDFADHSLSDRHRLAHDIAQLSAEICLTGSNDPDRMIARGARVLAEIIDSSSTAMVWMEEPAHEDQPSRVLHFSSSNSKQAPDEPDAKWLYSYPEELLDSSDHKQLCFRRSDISPDDQWPSSPLAKQRAMSGLYDFVRAVVSCRSNGLPRVLHIELAGQTKDWSPSDYELDLVCAASTIMRAAYIHRKVLPDDARRELLARLTPAQRQVAMLLMENLPEAEIASIIQRSPHTIHDHIKALFLTWRVHSKAEAIALWRHPLDPLSSE